MAQKKFLDLNGLLYFWNKVKGYVDAADANKVDKVAGKVLSSNDYTNEEKQKLAGLNNYTLPAATAKALGGIKVGAGLAVTADGILSATGGGTADAVAWENVIGRPENVSEFTNDAGYQTAANVATAIAGKADKTYVDEGLAGKADSTHTHTKAQITDFPTAMKNPSSIKVQINSGTTEGTNQFTYDGSAEKVVDITLAGIGAAAASHTHTKSQITDMPTKLSDFANDSGFQNASQVEAAITDKGYQTSVQVESAITSKGYQTASDVDNKLTAYAKKTDISAVYRYKGSVANYAALPVADQQVGDTYNVQEADSSHNIKAGDNVSWNGTDWDVLSGTVDLSGYVEDADLVAITNEEIDTAMA